MNSSIMTLLIAGILSLGIVVATPLNVANAADKTINCNDDDGCKINFKGKNNVDIIIGGAGQQGEQGEKGEKGDKGDTGEAGPEGPQGPQGEQGEQGEKGEKGDTGEQGPQGEQGPAGEDGQDGTTLDEDTVNGINELTGKLDIINEIIDAYENGTLGVPTEVEEPQENETDDEPIPTNDTDTEPEPLPDNDTDTEPEPLPDNQTDTTPNGTSGNNSSEIEDIPANETGVLTNETN